MFVPCILSGTAITTWFKSMQTLLGYLKKKTKLGQAAKSHTARQSWTPPELRVSRSSPCYTDGDQTARQGGGPRAPNGS